MPAYVPEPVSQQIADRFLEMEQTCVSRLTEVEFFSALSRKVRTGELPKALAHEIILVFDRHIQSGFFLPYFGLPMRCLTALAS